MQNLTQNGELKRYSWETQKKKRDNGLLRDKYVLVLTLPYAHNYIVKNLVNNTENNISSNQFCKHTCLYVYAKIPACMLVYLQKPINEWSQNECMHAYNVCMHMHKYQQPCVHAKAKNKTAAHENNFNGNSQDKALQAAM